MNKFDFNNRTAVITGGGQGFGLDIAKRFLNSGAKVIIWDIDEELLQSAVKEVNHSNLSYNVIDVSNYSQIEKTVSEITTQSKIDILINNAGILINKPFVELSKKEFISVYDVNFFGVIELIQGILPFFKSKSQIINISSIGGINGTNKFKGLSAYSSSKGALNILTEVLAEEFKETGPVINSLCLGSVQTKMIEQAFPGYKAQVQPKEMANFIYDFSQSGGKIFNGKIIPISLLDT